MNKAKKFIRNTIYLLIGTLLYAVGVSLFLQPNQLVAGGLSGISILINHISGIPVGTLYFVLNIPIMLLGAYFFGFKFIGSTALAISLFTVFTDILANFDPLTEDPLLAAFIGGISAAAGIGYVFRAGATTGGSDIIVRIIKMKKRHIKTGQIFMMLDMVIVAFSVIVFGNIEIALYAAVALFVSSVALNYVLYGPDGAKLVYIVSKQPDEITKRLHAEDIGVTYLNGSRTYDRKDAKIIFCAVRQQRLPGIREIVNQIDDTAFMIITSATEIFGEGFKSHKSEDL
ncbi:MAG: YitT family protein [Lachnospiraceae bacterium]|nr:YitT family protein [Lachnospiraceae bacterium]